MKVTNRHNLPNVVFEAIADDQRKTPPQFGLTTLLRPAHLVALEIKHWDDLTVDAMDQAMNLFGSAIHDYLAKSAALNNHEGDLVEHAVSAMVEGVAVRGVIDHYTCENGVYVLRDYKATTVWSVIYGKREWEAQLNLYAAMLEKTGRTVDRLEAVVFLRDWNQRQAKREHDYPAAPIVTLQIVKWPRQRAFDFLRERVLDHEMARVTGAAECSSEERWERPTTYAVIEKGKKRASRVLSSQQLAHEWATTAKLTNYFIEERPGEQTRCERYCSVARFCPQFAQLKEKAKEHTNDSPY